MILVWAKYSFDGSGDQPITGIPGCERFLPDKALRGVFGHVQAGISKYSLLNKGALPQVIRQDVMEGDIEENDRPSEEMTYPQEDDKPYLEIWRIDSPGSVYSVRPLLDIIADENVASSLSLCISFDEQAKLLEKCVRALDGRADAGSA